jgi:hypothetical protein
MLRKMFYMLGALLLLVSGARASDPVGIYAVIDRVEVEPSTGEPDRVRIWGVFALADKTTREYAPPARGVIYCKLPAEKGELARREWKDLQKLAGTKQCVGLGSRYKPLPLIRKPDGDPTKDPDVYPVGFGLTKIPATHEVARVLLAEQSKPKK